MICNTILGVPNRAVQSATFTNRDLSIRQRSFALTLYGPSTALPRFSHRVLHLYAQLCRSTDVATSAIDISP